jgi:hypothetical protein
VFLSYAGTDEAWVRRLAEDRKHYGLLVWLDEDEIRPGDRFVDALEQGAELHRGRRDLARVHTRQAPHAA